MKFPVASFLLVASVTSVDGFFATAPRTAQPTSSHLYATGGNEETSGPFGFLSKFGGSVVEEEVVEEVIEEPAPSSPFGFLSNAFGGAVQEEPVVEEVVTPLAQEKSPVSLPSLENLNLPDVDASKIVENTISGDFGARGEAYFAAQAVVLLSVLFGGLPIVGDSLPNLAGATLLALGSVLLVSGGIDLGDNLSPWPKPADGAELVQDGIYGEVRHPMYSGLLALCFGFSLVTGSADRLLLSGLLWYILELKTDVEEEELQKSYPGYSDYMQKVPGKFVPEELVKAMPWN